MLDGGMDQEDSLSVANIAREGEAMRITTGAGTRHSEFPAGGRACNGLQLWVNLPGDRKDTEVTAVEQDCDGFVMRTERTTRPNPRLLRQFARHDEPPLADAYLLSTLHTPPISNQHSAG